MRNSLSELDNFAIAVGNLVVVSLWDSSKDIYMCRDLNTDSSILIQVPKNMELKIGKTYSVLGRICNHDYSNIKTLRRVPMVYIYSIKRSKISSLKGMKFYLPSCKLNSDLMNLEIHELKYRDILISVKETECTNFVVLIDSLRKSMPQVVDNENLLEANLVSKREQKEDGNHTFISKGNSVKFNSLKWVAKNFNIAFN